MFAVEVAGFGHDRRREVFTDPAACEQRAHSGQVEVQGAGDSQPSGAVERGDSTRQADLVADPAPDHARIECVVGDLSVDLGAGERDHLRLLGGGQRAPQLLEDGDAVDPIAVRAEGGLGGQRAEPGEQGRQLGDHRITRVRTHVRNSTDEQRQFPP